MKVMVSQAVQQDPDALLRLSEFIRSLRGGISGNSLELVKIPMEFDVMCEELTLYHDDVVEMRKHLVDMFRQRSRNNPSQMFDDVHFLCMTEEEWYGVDSPVTRYVVQKALGPILMGRAPGVYDECVWKPGSPGIWSSI